VEARDPVERVALEAVEMSHEEYLELFRAAALAAEAGLRGRLTGMSAVTGIGADGAGTFEADRVAEDSILGSIRESGFGGTVISEEKGEVSFGRDRALIVVDPLDGSNNAVKGIPFCGISLALLEDMRPRVAYVKMVGLQREFHAIEGRGAFEGNRQVRTSGVSSLKDAFISLARPGHDADFTRYEKVMRRARRVRIFGGSAIEICFVAAGILDAYLNLNITFGLDRGEKLVDVAASSLILREAGGVVLEHDGTELRLERDLRRRSNLLAVANGTLYQDVASLLR